ncbi:serine/threonine protein kinase [Savitreella phatthalungensis]
MSSSQETNSSTAPSIATDTAAARLNRDVRANRTISFEDGNPATTGTATGDGLSSSNGAGLSTKVAQGRGGLGRIRSRPVTRQNSSDNLDTLPGNRTPTLMLHANNSSVQLEDLETFPSTSLHSFSFAVQHDTVAARHDIVKRSIEYLRERLARSKSDPHGQYSPERLDADEALATARKKVPRRELKLDLHGVNDVAFDPTRQPPKTAPPMGVTDEDFSKLLTATPDSGSGRASPVPSSTMKTSVVPLTVANSYLPPPSEQTQQTRRRASISNEPYAELGRHLQASLSCTDFTAVNSYYQQSPLVHIHHNNRWGQQNTQAVFSTSLNTPWIIQSANDYATMIFGVGREAIRQRTSLLDYIVEDRRDWLRRKLTSVQAEPSAENRVLLCGDVLPVIKRLSIGAASVWVKERITGLVWVIEEIEETVATVTLDAADEMVSECSGDPTKVFEREIIGLRIAEVLPTLPRNVEGRLDLAAVASNAYYAMRDRAGYVPCTVGVSKSQSGLAQLRVSFLPHVAGIVLVSADSLDVKSANAVFCSSLFGHADIAGMPITKLIPQFAAMLRYIGEHEGRSFDEGDIIPELAFRDAARKVTGLEMNLPLRGIESVHRDGSIIPIDIQMRIAKAVTGSNGSSRSMDAMDTDAEERLYALWISFEKGLTLEAQSEVVSSVMTTAMQATTSPSAAQTPAEQAVEGSDALGADADLPHPAELARAIEKVPTPDPLADTVPHDINSYQILEDMGAGAYGQVKLARYGRKRRKVVLKYVIKSRILVDTWTRDRKLGTVPLEIHVLSRLQSHPHRNLVEMKDFFEDDRNYYIVMGAHLPGMDLFDFIELNTNMDEHECIAISLQVARALHHLHELDIVHRDIKDENVVIDRSGWIKLIDFGSANYCRNGPFDTFHGTLDYASPEALEGKPYMGKEQDVWACGILFYTLVYKENPFYNIDEIMDRELRVPYILSERSIDLIRRMLNRDVNARLTMKQVLDHGWFEGFGDEIFQVPVKIDIPSK